MSNEEHSDDTSSADDTSSVSPENFNAPDADVTFRSSDNILFHLHRKNLETQAAAFPSSEFPTNGEIVELTEDASTLNNLFEYVYPRRHPDLEDLPVEEFFKLAEAAEKYEVFGVIASCKLRIKQLIAMAKHPSKVLNFAAKHDYPDLMSSAAPLLLDVSPEELAATLLPCLFIPWTRYREYWDRVGRDTVDTLYKQGGPCGLCVDSTASTFPCVHRFWFELGYGRSRKTLHAFVARANAFKGRCEDCGGRTSKRSVEVQKSNIETLDSLLDAIPKFDTLYI